VQLMRRIQDERNLCFVFISHDVGLTAAIADRMIVFRAGEISDAGPTQELLEHSRDEYTRELIAGSLFTPEDLQ
jgi:peptide/nickel transport system ATP-binding protein